MSDIAVVIALKMHVKHNILHKTTKHIKDHVKAIPWYCITHPYCAEFYV